MRDLIISRIVLCRSTQFVGVFALHSSLFPITLPRFPRECETSLARREISRLSSLLPATIYDVTKAHPVSDAKSFFSPSLSLFFFFFQISSTQSHLFRWSRTLVSNFSANHSPGIYSYLPFIPSFLFLFPLSDFSDFARGWNELVRTSLRFRRVSFTVRPSSASFDYDSSAFYNSPPRFHSVSNVRASRLARVTCNSLAAVASCYSVLWARHCWKVYILQVTRVNSRNFSLKI